MSNSALRANRRSRVANRVLRRPFRLLQFYRQKPMIVSSMPAMIYNQPGLFDIRPTRTAGTPRFHRCLILPKYLAARSDDLRLKEKALPAQQIFLRWADLETSGKLAKANESQLEAEFITQVFAEALHYPLRSKGGTYWEFQPKLAVPEGTADAAIGRFTGGVGDEAQGIVELKGPKVDLDRDRSRGQTPVQQMWGYLNSLPDCPWGIVSNFVTFRLYHHRHAKQQFELFTLQELRDSNRFLQFYTLFERDGLLAARSGEPPRAADLLKKTESALKIVGSELYDDYHKSRVALIKYLLASRQKTTDQAIHIAQKLMDRIVFVAFCQCRLLLPTSSIQEAATHYSKLDDVTNPRWQNFLKLFRAIDRGSAEIPAYNGGLFAKDPEVDDIDLLSDEWTEFFVEIGGYDFESEVNVDVLGRIFERSVTDLEAVRVAATGAPSDKLPENGKRKREGIYYTPPRITAYNVEQAAGTVLRERFASLAKVHDITPDMEPTKATLVNWLAYQNARLDVLRRFRVLDPACGSGAFLIAAFDYLEDTYDEVLSALTLNQGLPQRQADAIKGDILRNNLFGVDISAESVEITQLALWLRTAERGKRLSDLSANIRRGNSLVDDPAVDPLAFDWKKEFPAVFADGGFDCIVGNPPYVKLQNFKKFSPKIAAFLPTRYKAASTGNFDLYLPFIERGIELLGDDGVLGFIAPNVWIFNEYGAGLRELIAAHRQLAMFDDFKSFQVFDDATTYTALQFFRKRPSNQIEVADVSKGPEHLRTAKRFSVSYESLGTAAWALLPADQRSIVDAMRARSVTLEEASKAIIVGIQTSADPIYHLVKMSTGRYFSHKFNSILEIEDAIMRPLISSEGPIPYAQPEPPLYLLFPYKITKGGAILLSVPHLQKKCPKAWEYLKRNEPDLRRREAKMDHDGWYGFVYPKNLDKQELPKIGVPQTVDRLQAFIDPKGKLYFNNVRVNGILPREDGAFSLWYLLALLNSAALDYCFRLTAKPKDREYFEANKQFIAPLPIPNIKPTAQKPWRPWRSNWLSSMKSERSLFIKSGAVSRRILLRPNPAAIRRFRRNCRQNCATFTRSTCANCCRRSRTTPVPRSTPHCAKHGSNISTDPLRRFRISYAKSRKNSPGSMKSSSIFTA